MFISIGMGFSWLSLGGPLLDFIPYYYEVSSNLLGNQWKKKSIFLKDKDININEKIIDIKKNIIY